MIGFWLLALLFLLLLASGPWWPHSRGWGYKPTVALLAVLLSWLVVWFGWVAFAWPWATVTPLASVG